MRGCSRGGMRGGACVVKGGMRGKGGACMVKGGHAWQRGACVAKGGHAWQRGACMAKGGHAWQRGACMAKGGVHGKGGPCMAKGGHAWYAPPRYGWSLRGRYASYGMHSCFPDFFLVSPRHFSQKKPYLFFLSVALVTLVYANIASLISCQFLKKAFTVV